MIRLIRGESYRLCHKKSIYIYLAALTLGYILLAFIRAPGFTDQSVVTDADNLFMLAPALLGGIIFSTIYLDDLRANSLLTLIGSGLGRTRIVAAKFLLTTFVSTLTFGLLPLLHGVLYWILGGSVTAARLGAVYLIAFKYLLITLGYIALSSAIVYATRRPSLALAGYMLLAFTVIGSLLLLLTHNLGLNIAQYLLTGITVRITDAVQRGTLPYAALLEYLALIIGSSVLAVIALDKKEVEF
ncbi:MAG: hypothetical protein ACOX2M_00300 [Fastidiosipilaceae bacterium]|jgi:ABC-type transport system involved in multi-copper enzyme maturation permease subunit